MKKETVNEFKDALNLDLNPIVTPNTVLTDNLNGTFITYNGNEFCLQNDRGNTYKADLIDEQDLNVKYIPIGAKEHNGIIYIAAVENTLNEPKWILGCYPGLGDNNELDYNKFSLLPSIDLNFDLKDLFDKKHPVTIEIQDSYDGSVNLIIVDNKNRPRMINSGFSVLPNNQYKLIERNNNNENVYNNVDETELIRTSSNIVNFDLIGVQAGGQLKGGNYTFYLKFGDGDYNKTDVVAESGIVSIFKGNDGVPSTISGTLADERTDKMVQLKITGIDSKYSKLYLYYTREYSDTQGFRMTESCALIEPIDIKATLNDDKLEQSIWINGFEQVEPINIEELNVDYHTIDWARAEAQHSNMLFLGNVGQKETFELYETLKNYSISENISTTWVQENNVGYVDVSTFTSNTTNTSEYYSVKNIYDKTGYWPNEYYRFGIVYILKDGSTTPVFNILGDDNNEFGVFKTPDLQVLTNDSVNPISLKVTVNNLPEDVVGYFIVRQKRIPLTICQGLAIGIDKVSHTPLINNNNTWITESFISHKREDFGPTTTNVYGKEYNPALIYNDLSIISDTDTSSEEDPIPIDDNNRVYYIFKIEVKSSQQNGLASQTYDPDDINSVNRVFTNINSTMTSILSARNIDMSDEQKSKLIGWNVHTRPSDWNQNSYWGEASLLKQLGYWNGENWVETTEDNIYFIEYSDSYLSWWNNPRYNNHLVCFADTFLDGVDIANVANSDISLPDNTYENRKFININANGLNTWGIVSLDPCVNSTVSSVLDGSKFIIKKEYNVSSQRDNIIIKNNILSKSDNITDDTLKKCIFIPNNTNMKVLDEYSYSNVVGSSTDVKGKPVSTAFYLTPRFNSGGGKNHGYQYIDEDSKVIYYESGKTEDYLETKSDHQSKDSNRNINLIRGRFLPYIGIASSFSGNTGIYSIRNKDVDESITIRKNDNSPFYAVSKRCDLETNTINVYRGDCYSCTVGMRVVSNFIDNTAPVSEEIVDPYGWSYYVTMRSLNAKNEGNRPEYDQINLSDINTVSLGCWVTFKCLSSYNLGLRSVDPFHTDEMALLGSPRSFYPLNGASTATGNKMEESFLLNDGYSATVGEKRYNLLPDQPYYKSEFANRIMFSNVHITDAFTNGYRTFQGLSYKDYDKQYGAITKLVPYGQNLLVIMEHGIGLVSVNPKALMQTTTGEAIHIYGYGVLPNEMTIISQDYGTKYEHSVVRTPIGVYGIDVDAKKIWLYSDKQGFQTISDMNIETFLKDYLKPVNVKLPGSDVRTHYNAFKGDLMFTWKDAEDENSVWNICYNERNGKWVTRYDWCPIVSENINDKFYSLQEDESSDPTCVKIWSHTPNSDDMTPEPTEWYNKQHVFEFEFVVSDPIGVNKIFDNLQIISNNTQPEWLEIAVMGDSYMNKRELVTPTENRSSNDAINTQQVKTTSNLHNENIVWPDDARFGRFKWDWRLKENLLIKWQPFKDIYKFGRRIGNIQYKDSVWYTNIEPIIMNGKEVRIRDKWARIRIRYSGEDMAVITAIRTLINI